MNNILSVSQLYQHTQSTSSSITGTRLIGRMAIGDQGSIILHDANNADCTIGCRTDRFHHDLQDVLVVISQWQWIIPNDATMSSASWIEFLFQHVSRVGSDVPVLQQIAREDELAVQLFRAATVTAQPTLAETSITPLTKGQGDDQRIHMAVQVNSKSVLCGNQFFLGFATAGTMVATVEEEEEEKGDTSRWKERRMIAFQGDNLIPYYHDYQIGSFYLFVNLAIHTTNKQCVKFVEYRSHGYTITKDEYDAFLSSPAPIAPSPVSHTGLVTRVIDPYFGIYELDHQIMACFFHCFNYNFMYPYRVGTRLRISTFHVVKLSASSSLVPFWQIETKNTDHFLMLVACLCSHIQTDALPDSPLQQQQQLETDLAQPSSPASIVAAPPAITTPYLFRECCLTQSNFPCLLQKLEIHGSLYQKHHQHLDDEALALATIATIRCLMGRRSITDWKHTKFGSVMTDIFQHDQHCSAMGEDQTIASPLLHRYPPLKNVIEELMVSEDRQQRLPSSYAMVSNTQEQKNVYLAQYAFPCIQGDENIFVLGILESDDDDGRLYFMDDTYRIPIVMQSAGTLPSLGDLYLLRKFHLIQEDLSYTQNTGNKIKLDSTYIICNASDMLRTAPVASRTQALLHMPPISAGAVHHFTAATTTTDDAQDNICALFIKAKQHVALRLDNNNQFSLTAHASAVCYTVRSSDNNNIENKDISPPIEVNLTMRSGGLRYWSQLKNGHWYALLGGAKVQLLDPAPNPKIPKEAINTCSTVDVSQFITSKAKAKQFLQPVFNLDSDTCLLRADELNSSSSNSNRSPNTIIRLTPITPITQNTAVPPVDLSPPIYQITDLLRPDPEKGPTMITIQDRFFQDLINVQGVVIGKTLCETQVPQGKAYEHSEELYRRFGVGTGQAGRTIMFRLRQIGGLDTFDVYMDVSSRLYPLGIIPGTQVTFYDLVRRKRPDGNIHGQAMASTTVEINCTFDPAVGIREAFARDLIPRRRLVDVKGEMTQIMIHTVFQTDCTVQGIPQLSLKWMCTRCGTVVSHNACFNLCKQPPRIFVAEAVAEITDGTAKARLLIETEEHVVRLLMLPPNAVAALKETALEEGNLVYESWLGDNQTHEPALPPTNAKGPKTLEDLCRDQISRPFTIYGRVLPRRKRRKSSSDDVLSELKVSSIQVNNEVNDPFLTINSPQLRIKAIELEPLDPADVAWSILNKLDKKDEALDK